MREVLIFAGVVLLAIFAWISYEMHHAWPIDKDGLPIHPKPRKFNKPPGIGTTVEHPVMPFNKWMSYIKKEVNKSKKSNQKK